MTNTDFHQLLHRFREDTLTQEEWERLRTAIDSGLFDEELDAALRMAIQERTIHPSWQSLKQQKVWMAIQEDISTETRLAMPVIAAETPPRDGRRVHFIGTAWFRTAAAAMLILIFGAAAYFWYTQTSDQATGTGTSVAVNNDVIAPSSSRAVITLANGKQIFLDSAGNGTLATQGKVNIKKMSDGRIVYDATSEAGQLEYNILTIPRGSQIASIVLSDGTKVFLNAASSLRYPVAFNSNERRVEITGEAYFEVAKDPTKKFIVSGGGITTEVLGTHFNVNTYTDEEATKVTLLEGSVKVAGGASGSVIKPGEQAAFANGVVQVNPSVNIEQVMAWKNGRFNFQDQTLQQIMRQLSRWYDLKVVYEPGIREMSFGGDIPMNLKLSAVLGVLEGIDIHFEMEDGKVLRVKP